MLALLVLEDADLGVAVLADDGSDDRDPVEAGTAHTGFAVACDEQHVFEGDGRADLSLQPLDAHDVTRIHSVLLAARPDDRVHRQSPSAPSPRNPDTTRTFTPASITP